MLNRNGMEPLQGNSSRIQTDIGLDPHGLAEHSQSGSELLAIVAGQPRPDGPLPRPHAAS